MPFPRVRPCFFFPGMIAEPCAAGGVCLRALGGVYTVTEKETEYVVRRELFSVRCR